MNPTPSALFSSGYFFVGCNYWASHAGTRMWSDWKPEIIEQDFQQLAASNIQVLRIFPLWSDFQPLRMHLPNKELRLGEEPLPDTEAGRAGLSQVMVERFGVFCDLAEKYGFRLIIGLITGWMSGRHFFPEAFIGHDLIRDPLVVRWQIRFIRYMVRRFREHPAIAAWELGNECNCMDTPDRDAAFTWSMQLTNAMRVEDPTRPVLSGMHGLLPEGVWTPQDQGEATDVLSTHPYPLFTPHCGTDPVNEMKSPLHSTAESVMYASLSGKPCFIEEAGTLGPMIASEAVAADYVRTALFSAWAHDLRGFLWWCANEQSHLEHTPYDWCAVERELGLFRLDGSPKPVAHTISGFSDFVTEVGCLPQRLTDAVCILTHSQDAWATAYGSFILAKQAGLDITFHWCDDALPEANVYLLPALSGLTSIYRRHLMPILERVKAGASLYLSINDVLLSPFEEITGIRVKIRAVRQRDDLVTLDGKEIALSSPNKYVFENIGAEILAETDDGNPALTKYAYGKGNIYFCAYPIELHTACNPGVVSGDNAKAYYRFYEKLNLRSASRIAARTCPYLGLTEHVLNENQRLLLLVNYTPREISDTVTLQGYRLGQVHCLTGGSAEETESGIRVTVPGNTGIVVSVSKAL